MNKKAQVGIIGSIILFLMFIVAWFVFLGGWINEVMANIVLTNGFTGIEAFILMNFNFMILIIILLAMIGWTYFGGGQN